MVEEDVRKAGEREVGDGVRRDGVGCRVDDKLSKELEENNPYYRLLFEASNEGMLLSTSDGAILDANPEACRVLQRTREEIVAAGLDAFFDSSDPRLGPAREEQRSTGRFRGELRLLRGDGTPFPAEVSMVVYEVGKDMCGLTFRDITERKMAEEELRRSKEFFRILVENALDVIAVQELDSTVRYINPAIEQALGYRPEEFVGTNPLDLIHSDDLEQVIKDIAEVFDSPGPFGGFREYRYRHKDGSHRYLQARVNNLLDDPNVRGVISTVRDVTERRRIEEELRFFRILVENIMDLIAVQEPDTTARYLSPSIERVLGYRPEELVGTKIADLVHPDDREQGMKETAAVFSKPGPAGRFAEHRFRHKDGSYRYLQASANNMLDDPSIRGLICIVRDVTEHKQLEEALRESEERYRRLVELSPDAVMVHSNGRLLYVNPAGVKLLGAASSEELVGRRVLDFAHPDYRELIKARMAGVQEVRKQAGVIGEKIVKLDGKVVDVEATSTPISYEGEPAVLSVIRDVTERKRAQERERFLSLLVENAEDVVGVVDADGTIRYLSPSVERVLGYRPEEMVGTNSFDYLHPDELEWAASVMADAVSTPGPSQRVEFRYRHKDGSWRYLESTGNNLLVDPYIKGILCVFRDITRRKQAEEALRESEQRLRMVTENMLDFVLVSEADGAVRYLSPSIERVLGYTPEEFSGFKPHDVLHPDDAEKMMAKLAEARDNPGINAEAEFRYRHKDGSWRWISSIANNLLHDPDVGALVISGRDVTERKRVEEELRFLSLLVQNARDIVGVLDADSTVRYISPSIERVLGYQPEEFIGTKALEYIHPEDRERVTARLADVSNNPEFDPYLEVRHRHKDGSWRWLEGLANDLLDDPSVRGIVFVSRDITARKRVEDALRQAEEKYRALIEQVPVVTYMDETDDLASSIYVSPQIEGLLGYSLKEWDEDRLLWSKRLHPEDESQVHAECYRCRDSGETFKMEYRLIAKDGNVVWVRDEATVVHDEEGRPRYWRGVKLDITEQKRAEERLRESEERFRLMFENALDMVVVRDANAVVRYASPSVQRVLGRRPEEFVGTHFTDTVHPDDLEMVSDWFARVASKPGGRMMVEGRQRHKDGSYRTLQAIAHNMLDNPSVRGVLLNTRDITELRRAEEKVRQLNKTLEKRVAERTAQLENAVAKLQSNEQMLRESEQQLQDLVGKLLTAHEDERRHVAYEIHDGLAQVASAALQHLQAFAGRYYTSAPTEDREELDRSLELVRQTVEDARSVIADLRPTVLDDFGLAAALRQKVKALHAEGWEITYDEVLPQDERLPEEMEIALYRVAQEALNNVRKHAGTTRVHVELRRTRARVRLEVRDQGYGFKPVESSFSGGPGERVGVSSMRERVGLLGGEFEIHSQPGVGTAIVAEMPLPEPPREEDADRASEHSAVRLIIADDHDLSRSGLRSVLEGEEDLNVIGEAKTGREALELCRRLRPDVVLMDVRMPEMDGLAATRAITREHPYVSVVMVTMHEDPDYMYEALKAGAAGYVLKNATQGELIRTVRKVIGGESLLNPALATRLLQRLASEDAERGEETPSEPEKKPPEMFPEPLTQRETEVLKLLARGQSNREIARTLVISPGTAKLHVHHVIAKLGVSDRTQAAIRAIELGLLDLNQQGHRYP